MDSESLVNKFLERYSLRTERFTKQEMRAGKTPDFKVYSEDKIQLYCEVKNAEKDTWLDDQLDQAEMGRLVGGLRNDPIFNKLTAHIHNAVKQFEEVNPHQEIPNVLAFHNENEDSGFLDLLAVTTGNFFEESGSVFPIYKNFSEGRVKQDIEKTHLFIWLDDYKPHRFLFNTINSKFQNKLCNLFGFDPDRLEIVSK